MKMKLRILHITISLCVVAAFSYLLTRKERSLGRLLLTERSLNTLQIGKNK